MGLSAGHTMAWRSSIARPTLLASALALGLAGAEAPGGGAIAQTTAPASATVSGCVTDTLAKPIPTGWVVATSPTVERLTRADSLGCYRLTDLPPGTYTVRATVPGFCDGVHGDVVVTADANVTVPFALRVGPMSESISYEWRGWAEMASRVDAVVRLRIEETLETKPWPSSRRCGSDIYTEMRAGMLSVVKAPPSADIAAGSIRFLWNGRHALDTRSSFGAGEEYVAFLSWAPDLGRLTLTEAGLMAPVSDGRVTWVLGSSAPEDRKPVAQFISDLSALVERSRKVSTARAWGRDYEAFVAKLPTARKESILAAREELLKYIEGEKRCGNDDACAEDVFDRFRTFYEEVIRTCDSDFFGNKPAQNVLARLASSRIESATKDRPLVAYERSREETRRQTPADQQAALDEVLAFRDCGIDFYFGEGDWYLRDDPDFLVGLSARLPDGEYKDAVGFTAAESRLRVVDDASIEIPVDDLRQMVVRWDRFEMTHPAAAHRFRMREQTDRLLLLYLEGTDNTRAFDRVSGRLSTRLRESLTRFLKTNQYCSYYSLIAGWWDLLKTNDFRQTAAVQAYLQKNVRSRLPVR